MTTVCPICNSSAQELPRTGDATGFHSGPRWARRIASNIAKLPDDDLDELAATSPFSVGFHAPRARAAR